MIGQHISFIKPRNIISSSTFSTMKNTNMGIVFRCVRFDFLDFANYSFSSKFIRFGQI